MPSLKDIPAIIGDILGANTPVRPIWNSSWPTIKKELQTALDVGIPAGMATAPLGKAQRFLNVDTGRVYPQQVGKFLKTMEEQVGKLAQTPEWLQYKKDQIAFVRDLIKSAAKDSKGRVKVKDVWDATQKVPQGPMTTEGRGGLRPLFYRTLQDRTSYTGIKTAGQGRQIWDEALPYTSPNPVEKGATEAYYGILSKMREK